MLNEVSEHLDKLLHSATFKSSPKTAALLRRLTVPLLDRTNEPPKEYTLGIELFGRPTSWDPHLDSVVRTNANRLRHKLREYYFKEGKDEPMRIELDPGCYLPKVSWLTLPQFPGGTKDRAVASPAKGPAVLTRRAALGLAGATGVVGAGMAELLRPSTISGSARLTIHRLTYERGDVTAARFTPDGRSFVFSARWGGQESHLYLGRIGQRFSQPLAYPTAELQDLSKQGELLLTLGDRQIGTLARAELSGGPMKEIAEQVADAKWLPNGKDIAVARIDKNSLAIEFPIGSTVHRNSTTMGAVGLGISPSGGRIAWVDGSRGYLDIYYAEQGKNPQCVSRDWMLISGNLQWQSEGSLLLSGSRRGVPAIQRVETGNEREASIYTCPLVWSLFDQNARGTILAAAADSRLFVSYKSVVTGREETFPALASAAVAGISHDGSCILLTEILGPGTPGNLPVLLLKPPGMQPITLGEGFRPKFSQRGTEVAWVETGKEYDSIVVSPVSTGSPKRYPIKGVRCHSVEWIPGTSERFLLNIAAPDGSTPSKIVDLSTTTIKGIPGAPSVSCVSPEGWAVSSSRNTFRLIQIESGRTRDVCPMSTDWRPLRWDENAQSLFVYEAESTYSSGKISRIDVRTGSHSRVVTLHPVDDTGVYMRSSADITPDGKFCAYTYQRDLADLFTIDGLLEPTKS